MGRSKLVATVTIWTVGTIYFILYMDVHRASITSLEVDIAVINVDFSISYYTK